MFNIFQNYGKNSLERMENHYGFIPEFYQVMAGNSGIIALNTSLRMICIIEGNSKPHFLDKSNLKGAQVLVDETGMLGKKKLSTLLKYHFFKSTLGESAADLSIKLSKNIQTKRINSIKLQISTTDLIKPNLYLTFLKNGNEAQKNRIFGDVLDWITRIESICS